MAVLITINYNAMKPICFFDIESTGTSVENDRIVEISILKVSDSEQHESKTRKVNPGIPIPKGASDIHGILDEHVANEPKFAMIAKGVYSFIEGCDIAGFNSNRFDVPMLYNEFLRAGITWDYTKFRMIDVGNIYKIFEPRTLSAGVKFYLGREHEGAHGAEPDVLATAQIFFEQVKRYQLPIDDMDQLQLISNFDKKILDLSGKFTYNKDNDVVFNFGPKIGVPVKLERGLVQWMLDRDFPLDTKEICFKILNDQLQ